MVGQHRRASGRDAKAGALARGNGLALRLAGDCRRADIVGKNRANLDWTKGEIPIASRRLAQPDTADGRGAGRIDRSRAWALLAGGVHPQDAFARG